MKHLPYVALFGAFVFGGCDDPVVCAGTAQFAIVVHVRDASTGAPAALGATLVVRDGVYADSATGTYSGPVEPFATLLEAAQDRPGTYDVSVRKAAYQTWTRQGVRVEESSCEVQPARFDVNLTGQ